jgi:hypothetical protein
VSAFDVFRMSALGQKQTFALQQAMSALPPIATVKADIRLSDESPEREQFKLSSRAASFCTRKY